MSLPATTLSGLFPVLGAGALIVQGLRRSRARKARGPTAAQSVPQPKEPVSPPRASVRSGPVAKPDHNCAGCGTMVPANQVMCGLCDRKQSPQASDLPVWLHWLIFAGMMLTIFGGAELLLH